MNRRLYLLVILFLGSTFIGFIGDNTEDFYKEVEEWHKRRISSLTAETGWLSLAGLYWLKQGENTFGSAKDNDIIFPGDTPKYMGTLVLKDSIVNISVKKNITIFSDSIQVTKMELVNDLHEDRTVLSHDNYSWYILKRQDKYGIRLKNHQHPNRKNFKGIDRYPVDIKWRIKARLEKYDLPKKLKAVNVLGQVSELPSPGKLVFEINGETFNIDPVSTSNGKRYWIIFGDKTNAIETYGAGRYLYIDAIDETGETYIDFNQCYNPPCAFSEFSTCTLPPKQNMLKIKVTAGEKSWDGGIH